MDKTKWDRMSLTEKVRWRNTHPIKNSWYYVDKILAKEIAAKKSPECKVAKIIKIPQKLKDIDIKKLPKDYIFKANHGSKWLIKVKNGKDVHTGEEITNTILINYARKWMGKIYSNAKEKQYAFVVPRVFFEEYLEDIIDYRCFCFDGKVKFIMVDITHSGKILSSIYDRNWKRIHAHWIDPEGPNLRKPRNLAKIIGIVEKLAAGIDFIRMDVFVDDGDIYFGEFTFTPNRGYGNITPIEFDRLAGSYWTNITSSLGIPPGMKGMNFGSKVYTYAFIVTYPIALKIKHALDKLRIKNLVDR